VRVVKNYDHVGSKCDEESTEDDCPGTFAHQSSHGTVGCPNRSRDMTHEQVEHVGAQA
jgi:hypothetical protein